MFEKLRLLKPDYDEFLDSLYSRDQEGQEFKSFDIFKPKEINTLTAAHGSTLNVKLSGGSNYLTRYSEEYTTSWELEKGKSKTGLSVDVLEQNKTKAYLKFLCNPGTSAEMKEDS